MINSKRKLCRIGVNDADYQVKPRTGEKCKYHTVWSNLINRCYSPSYQKLYPAYIDCTVADEWLTFSVFKEWMSDQNWESNHLDKDLLVKDNRIYSPSTCIFVSRLVNNFMTEATASRGDYPIGVYLNKSGSYIAQVKNWVTGYPHYLGSFSSQDGAHKAYLKQKAIYAHELASVQGDERVATALRLRYPLIG